MFTGNHKARIQTKIGRKVKGACILFDDGLCGNEQTCYTETLAIKQILQSAFPPSMTNSKRQT